MLPVLIAGEQFIYLEKDQHFDSMNLMQHIRSIDASEHLDGITDTETTAVINAAMYMSRFNLVTCSKETLLNV